MVDDERKEEKLERFKEMSGMTRDDDFAARRVTRSILPNLDALHQPRLHYYLSHNCQPRRLFQPQCSPATPVTPMRLVHTATCLPLAAIGSRDVSTTASLFLLFHLRFIKRQSP